MRCCSRRPTGGYNEAVSTPAPWHPPATNPVLAVATRSERVESWHRGAVVVVHEGEAMLSLGDVDAPVYARSAIKPLQALPLLDGGARERLQLPAAELAVMCASHDGTDLHVAAVRSLLARAGLDEERLGCGPHAPFARDARLALLRTGQRPLKVHNNCSGKHAGFLHLARACGDDVAHYLEPACEAQRRVNTAVAEMVGLEGPLPHGVDGCGAPTLLLSLRALAAGFCRFANHERLGPVRAGSCRAIFDAVGAAPVHLAGEQRFCTALARQWPGRVFPKNGAEGVYVLALRADPRRARAPGALGIAVKVDDGGERGYQPVVVDLLRWLGAFERDEVPDALGRFARLPIANTRQELVGAVHSVVHWERA